MYHTTVAPQSCQWRTNAIKWSKESAFSVTTHYPAKLDSFGSFDWVVFIVNYPFCTQYPFFEDRFICQFMELCLLRFLNLFRYSALTREFKCLYKIVILVQHSNMPPFSSTHKEHTQMEYLFVYAPGLCSTSYSMYCTTQGGGVKEWDKCLHLHVWGGAVSCKWDCYTVPVFSFGQTRGILFLLWLGVRLHGVDAVGRNGRRFGDDPRTSAVTAARAGLPPRPRERWLARRTLFGFRIQHFCSCKQRKLNQFHFHVLLR